MADIGQRTHDTCICPRDNWCGVARTSEVAQKTYQDGAAKAEEPIGRNKTTGKDLTERNGQDQVGVDAHGSGGEATTYKRVHYMV